MDQTNTVAQVQPAAEEPHPLKPLEDHLNGSKHNAGAAIKAIEDWFAKEVAKIRAEFSSKKSEVEDDEHSN
jgi:UDP-N-acetylglucosamine pyrophosphorylase